jgi:hypothetical protein
VNLTRRRGEAEADAEFLRKFKIPMRGRADLESRRFIEGVVGKRKRRDLSDITATVSGLFNQRRQEASMALDLAERMYEPVPYSTTK